MIIPTQDETYNHNENGCLYGQADGPDDFFTECECHYDELDSIIGCFEE